MEEEIQNYGPTDSFVNAPYQNMNTKAGQIISMKDMVNEEQFKKIVCTPKGQSSYK
jgi:hypothetical protein